MPDQRLVEEKPVVLEGRRRGRALRQPAPPREPYTPEPGPRAGERKAFNALRWAWLVVVVVVAIVVWAALR
jgi:hypothetical protein